MSGLPDNLPPEWDHKPLGEIASIKTGGPAPQAKEHFINGTLPFVRVQHFDGASKYVDRWDLITDEAVKAKRLKLFPRDTILFPKSGASIRLEKRAKLPCEAYVVSHLCCVSPIKADNDFLYYWLKRERFAQSSGGSTLPYLNLSHVEQHVVALPPLPEQKKIAHILSTVQRAIEAQERVIQITTELKKALMHKLFTEGLRNEPQKQTEIGLVPESWEVVELGELLTVTQYGMSVKGNPEGNYSILRMTNQVNGRIVANNLQFVEITDSEFQKFKLERGDILFNRTNSLDLVGRTAIHDIKGDFVFASYLIRIRTDEERLNPFFLNLDFNRDETQVRLKSIATRAVSQSNISATRLKGFPFPLPSVDDQAEIVRRGAALDSKIELHQAKLATLKDLFRTLLHELMTAKTRVHNI